MDLKQIATLFVEAVCVELASQGLSIEDLKKRVSRLETPGKATDQASPAVEEPLANPQSSLSPPMRGAVKDRHVRQAVFIVSTLLQNQKEGKDPKTLSDMLASEFPSERVGVRATTTILEELVEDGIVRYIELNHGRRSYNVSESKVSMAREWVLAHTTEAPPITEAPSIFDPQALRVRW